MCVPSQGLRVPFARTACPITWTVRPICQDGVSHNRNCASHVPGMRVPSQGLRVPFARTACPMTGT
eukprot:7938672-Pyramimonas_sp.AAC.1